MFGIWLLCHWVWSQCFSCEFAHWRHCITFYVVGWWPWFDWFNVS